MIRTEIRETLRLAIPLVLTNLGNISMSIADTIMIGWVGPEPLSAVALGNAFSFTTLLICMGTLMALDPIVSQAYGAGRFAECGRALSHGFVIAAGLTLPTMLFLSASPFFFRVLKQEPLLIDTASQYVSVINWSVFPFLAFASLRHFMQGVARARPALYVVLISNVLNIVLNWVFIYGHWGVPAMHSTGVAWATSIGRWFMFVVMLAYVLWKSELAMFQIRIWPKNIDKVLVRRMLRLGLPAGLQYGLEVGAFSAASVMMGWLGTLALAGHQIALNLCSTSYMVPLGLSSTAAVRVGHALGRGDVASARRAAGVAFAIGLTFMALAALAFYLFSSFWVGIYTSDTALLQMGTSLLIIGAAFQLSDGLQTIAIGALRGAADTRFPMFTAAVFYWLVGLPLGYFLAFSSHIGPRGLWYGLTASLTLVGVVLGWRFYTRVRPHRLTEFQAV